MFGSDREVPERWLERYSELRPVCLNQTRSPTQNRLKTGPTASTRVTHAVLAALDIEAVQVLVAPTQGDLQRVVELGDGAVTAERASVAGSVG